MESIADFIQLVEEMRSELRRHVITIQGLPVSFDESYLQIIRHDQAARLRILKSRIMGEVENIKLMELAAQTGYAKGTLLSSGMGFVIGGLLATTTGHKDVAQVGVEMASSLLSRKPPFDNVVIVIGKKGIPEGVEVVSVSRIARESNRNESEVKVSFKDNGHILITPDQFFRFLDKVEHAVHDGSMCLPIAGGEVMKQLTRW
ncbi:hypothetical protein ACFLV5_01480 [Chloroflexota bacterium]